MPSTRAKRTATLSLTKTTLKSASLAPLLETNSLSSDKKVKHRQHEIVFLYQEQTSWIYFTPKKDPKAEGEKKFKQVIKDSGWKGAKLVKIHPIPKAIDPPLTKAQKDAVRQRDRAKKSADARRPRTARSASSKPNKVSRASKGASNGSVLATRSSGSKVSKAKLSKNK